MMQKFARCLTVALAIIAATGCGSAAPVDSAVGMERLVTANDRPLRIDLPEPDMREVIAAVRVDAPAPKHAITLTFYAEDGADPIATPTLYPPDRPSRFLVKVPPGTRWLRVKAKPLRDCGAEGAEAAAADEAPQLHIVLQAKP